jgi:hypothetical protein
MIGLKRFIRPGFIVSTIGHVGALMLGLLFVGANSFESIPPDAMVVDIVPPNEVPRLEGTPSELRTSGSDSSSKSNSASAAAQPPPRKSTKQSPPQPQQPQQRSKQPRDASEAPASPHAAQPETAHAEMVHAEKAQPEAQNQSSEQQAAASPPQPEETPDQPAAEMVARLALVGGRLGGGFAAPPIDAAQATYDFTAPFRERVSACSARPAGIAASDNIRITLRVFLNPDGTLASPPQLLEPSASWKQQALMQSITDALQKCQPYTMLPAEKYKQWKTLDLAIFPLNFLGR